MGCFLCAYDFSPFRWAAQNGHLAVIERLLNFPDVFAYAEMHEYEYGSYVQDFMTPRLTHLAQEIDTFHATRLCVANS